VIPAPDRLEHDADRAWRRGPKQALKKVIAQLEAEPDTVAVSSMVPSLTAVDKGGRPITPGLLYGDGRGRTGGLQKSTDSDAGEVVGFLRWTAAEAPDARGYWSAPAVANYALGREAAVDIGTAFTSTPLFGDQGWDEHLAKECGARVEQLPRVEMMGAPIGRITGTGITLAGGCVDGMCEQIVAGADNDGDVLVICGTTLITWVVTSNPTTAPSLWSVPHTAPGKWAVGGPSNAGGLFHNAVATWLKPSDAHPPLDPDDLPIFEPYLRGERTPLHDIHRRGALHGLTLTHGPAALRRAAYEASGFVVRHHIDLSGLPATRIVATGGGTRVDGWMQAMADCTGLPVHVAAVPEGAALGAAYLGRMALGLEHGFDAAQGWAATGRIVDPDPTWQASCTDRYREFRAYADRQADAEGPADAQTNSRALP
jgi:xylulokinase